MTRFAFARWIPAVVALATAASLAGACTTHGAGGRCDIRNVPAGSTQNADCDNGLVCISGAELQLPDGGGSPQGYFCCPPPNQPITDPNNICYSTGNTIGDEAGIPDTGTTETGPSDATTDQFTDGGDDGASDSSIDDSSADASDSE